MSPRTRDEGGRAPSDDVTVEPGVVETPRARRESSNGGSRPWLRAHGLFLAATILAFGVTVGVLWHDEVLLLHDGPQHVFTNHLEQTYADPGALYGAVLEHGSPVSNLGFRSIFLPLDRVVGWRLATRISLSVVLLLWCASFALLVCALEPRRRWLALLGCVTAYQWAFYMGFWSFVVGLSVGFLALALSLWNGPLSGPVRWGSVAALLLLSALAHTFAAAIAGVMLLALAASARRPGRAVALLAVAVLPAAGLAAYVSSGSASGDLPPDFPPTTWLPVPDRVVLLLRGFVVGPLWRCLPLVVAAVAGAFLALRRGRRRRERFLAAAATTLLAASLLAPFHLSSWQFLSQRFAPMGVMVAVALLPVERLVRSRWRWAVRGAVLAYVAGGLGWSAHLHARLERTSADLLSGLDAPIARSGWRLPVLLDRFFVYEAPDGPWHAIPSFEPAKNVGQLYAVAQGGLVPQTFAASPKLHPFVFRSEPSPPMPPVPDYRMTYELADHREGPDSAKRLLLLTLYAQAGRAFEDVIVWGSRQDADLFVERGYRADFRQGGLFIGSFEGCRVTITARDRIPGAATFAVEHGMMPLGTAAGRAEVRLEDGRLAEDLVLEHMPCGPTWLRLAYERPEAPDRPAHCLGADPGGAFELTVRDGTIIECRARLE